MSSMLPCDPTATRILSHSITDSEPALDTVTRAEPEAASTLSTLEPVIDLIPPRAKLLSSWTLTSRSSKGVSLGRSSTMVTSAPYFEYT